MIVCPFSSVTGTDMNPLAMNASRAASSSEMLRVTNATFLCARFSFTISHGMHRVECHTTAGSPMPPPLSRVRQELLDRVDDEIRIRLFFVAHPAGRSRSIVVPWVEPDVVAQRLHLGEALPHLFGIAAGQVHPPTAADKERVARDDRVL